MITLESVLNNEFELYYSQEHDGEYEVEAVELANAITDMNIVFENVNAFSCAMAIMESTSHSQTVQMEVFIESIKNFLKKIKEALKKFCAFITGPFRTQTKNIDNTINDAAKNENDNNIIDGEIEEVCDSAADINDVKERNPKISIYSIPYDISFFFK